MTPSEYYDDEPEEEIDIENLRKIIYNEFLENLELAAGVVSAFPSEWQLQMLLNIMRDM